MTETAVEPKPARVQLTIDQRIENAKKLVAQLEAKRDGVQAPAAFEVGQVVAFEYGRKSKATYQGTVLGSKDGWYKISAGSGFDANVYTVHGKAVSAVDVGAVPVATPQVEAGQAQNAEPTIEPAAGAAVDPLSAL